MAQLSGGELVTRSAIEQRGSLHLLGGTSFQVIDAEPAVVYRALLDTPRYTRMLPTVTASRVLSEQAGSRLVRLEHKRGPLGVSYDVRARMAPDRNDITFLVERSPDGAPRAAWGFFSARPYADGKTLLSYGVMADPGSGIVVGLLRGIVHEWILRVPRQVKGFVESKEGRTLYR